MKYWPAVVSATVALAVAIPVLHELVPSFSLFERSEASAEKLPTAGRVGSTDELAMVELDRMFLGEKEATAPAGAGRLAHLTVDPRVQKAAETALKRRRIPVGGAMVMDLRSGAVLVYAGRHSGNGKEDPLTSASAAATDIFKLVTATALVNMAGARASTRICHRDPGKKLELDDLVEDVEKDTWCPSLAESLARNLDAPFARAAYRDLNADVLEKTARAYGFGAHIPFDVVVEPSQVRIPDTDLGLVETAVGADHATLSTLQGLMLAATIANHGVALRPVLVRSIEESSGKVVYRGEDDARWLGRVLRPEAAAELAKMMFETTEIGDAFRAFHDDTGHPKLGAFKAASKTGASRGGKGSTRTTWFVGFAPASSPEVAIATLARNRRSTGGNAKTLAVDILRAYFEPRMRQAAGRKPDAS